MKRKIRIWIFSGEVQESACYQIRFLGPFSYFSQDQFEFVYAPSLQAILNLPWMPDVVLFQRNHYSFREINKIVEFACLRNIITVMDIDDLITDVSVGHPAHLEYQEIKPTLIQLIRKMDFITVTNDKLKQYLEAYNSHVYVLPNSIDQRIWNKKEEEIREKINEDKLVVGYAGSPTHKYDFKSVIPAVKYILSKYSGKVCFKFLGCIPDELKDMPGTYYVCNVIDSYRQYADILKKSRFDFVIAPLEDNAFNQCKSNIKFLEYSICGFPGIYSAVGSYPDSIVDKETGLLTENTPDAWIQSMECLINKPQLRNYLGRNAYRYVKENYLLEEKSEDWIQFYSKLINENQKGLTLSFSLAPFVSYGPYFAYAQISKIYWKIRRLLKI